MTEQTLTKLLNKGFIGITVINFIVCLVYYLLMIIVVVTAQDSSHAILGQAGLASGICIIRTLPARLFMGRLLELIGRKQVLRYGALFYPLTTVTYIYMPSTDILCLVRFLNEFGHGIASTAANAIITAYIPKNKKREGINYCGLSTSLATGTEPFIGVLLLNVSNFHVIINLSIILILLTTIACFIFPVKNIELTPEHHEALPRWSLDSFVEKKALFITFIVFLMGLAYSNVLSSLSSYIKMIDLIDVSTFPLIVYVVVTTLTRPSTGQVFDVKGERYIMYPGYIFLTLGLFLLSMTTSGWVLLVSDGLIGLGYGTSMSNGRTVCLQESLSPHRIGIALSAYFIGLDLGLGVGPHVLGELRNSTSFQQMYFLAGCIPIVCTILYMIFHKAKNDTKDSSLETIEGIEHGSEL